MRERWERVPTTESHALRGASEALPALLPRGGRGFWEVLSAEVVSESWQTEMGKAGALASGRGGKRRRKA